MDDPSKVPAPDARAMVAQILTAATGLQAAIEDGLPAPVKGSSKPLERRSNQSKIAANPDLQAFIHARIMTATFASVVADVAARFPPEKHISMSSLHRWWHRHGKHSPPHPTASN
jgi:hypothetical protein